MKNIEQDLSELVTPLCIQNHIFMIDLRVHSGGRVKLIRITVDTEPGITLSECQNLTKQINDLFFRKDILNGNYRLEVSSPGIKKPLQFPYEYKRNLGRNVEVMYSDGDEIKKRSGELFEYDESHVAIRPEKGDTFSIPLEKIKETKIKLKW